MRRSTHRRGFSLIELLVVIAIVAILSAAAVMSLRGLGDAGQFNQSITSIEGILEQGRAYAAAQDTYVWVVIYQNTTASRPPDVYVGAFASTDGTDPLLWTGSVTVPSTAYASLTKISHFRALHMMQVTATSPGAPQTIPASTPAPPATTPGFGFTAQSDGGPVTLSPPATPSTTAPTYWVVQFTPSGSARNSANPISSIWLGFQPAHSATNVDTKNIASIDISGLTGGCTIYRP